MTKMSKELIDKNILTFSTVVVWYNPDEKSVQNILAYNSFCQKIYIVDNSSTDNTNLANKVPNAKYIPNFDNIGIAAALNKGCQAALDDNFEWCMTMDQDSSWNPETLMLFLKNTEKYISNKNVSFAPIHRNELKSYVGNVCYSIEQKLKNDSEEIKNPDKVMTSGNIINLKIWNEIGKFEEKLFIDEVDHEFCYRLHENEYSIVEFQDIKMIHTLGNVKKTILPHPCKHSGVRLFYIFRNMNYIKKNHPVFYKRNGYTKYQLLAIIQKIFEFNFKDINFIRLGIKAFKNDNWGKYI